MVRTRSGHAVFFTETSYGRAARQETTRRLQKRKLSSSVLIQDEADGENGTFSTPRRARKTRGQIWQEEDLATPPSANTRVGVTPPSRSERILRGRIPTCSDYGISRRYSFPGNRFFFCHACDLWDSLPPDRSKNCSRTSNRLACTANHTSFSHPTTFRKDYCSRGPIESVVMNDDSDSTCCTSTATDLEVENEAEEVECCSSYSSYQ